MTTKIESNVTATEMATIFNAIDDLRFYIDFSTNMRNEMFITFWGRNTKGTLKTNSVCLHRNGVFSLLDSTGNYIEGLVSEIADAIKAL